MFCYIYCRNIQTKPEQMPTRKDIKESEKVAQYSMRAASLQSGLSADVIRAWEKRYGAVAPQRTSTGRRFYGQSEVERLQLLREATLQGHSIGRVANLPDSELRALVGSAPTVAEHTETAPHSFFIDSYLEQCLRAAQQLDANALENSLARALVQFGPTAMIEELVAPLIDRIEEMWIAGTLQIAEVHLASATLRNFLSSLMRHAGVLPSAPTLVMAAPARQLHELGALLAGATAAHCGWKVLYLGANLPAAEIALAATRSRAHAVALSLVSPKNDTELPGELRQLRRALPDTAILVGGHAAPFYAATLKKIQAIHLEDLQSLREELAALCPPLAL
jgi:DNA-binding transcriptional MerR regulator/methylmalonyl-CoA mutase cobalamin-binding subunit